MPVGQQQTRDSAADALTKSQLSNEQYSFLSALMSDPNFSVKAAEEACNMPSGMGARWLKIDRVRAALGDMLRERRERHADVRDNVMLLLWRMICADPRTAFRSGTQLPPWELPDDLAACLERIEPVVTMEGTTVAWKYWFTKKASLLDMILKHFDAPKELRDSAADMPKATIILRGVGLDLEG